MAQPQDSLPQASSRGDVVGRRIGSYNVVRELGRGGMGAVFEAVHKDVGQRAAVKVMHPEFSREPKYVQRFFEEARAVSSVNHPGLVKLFDFGQMDDGTVYILMEFLEGESLRARLEDLLSRGRTPAIVETLRLLRQLASALCAVHGQGIVHRDLKPENIVLVPDPETTSGVRPKILDFGLARSQDPGGGRHLTTEGRVVGTPSYMSPEQCAATPVDEKSDVYSLGIMAYEMLAGHPPFEHENWLHVLMAHAGMEPEPLRQLLPALPEELAALVHQMLAKKPAERPVMTEVLGRLDQLLSDAKYDDRTRASGEGFKPTVAGPNATPQKMRVKEAYTPTMASGPQRVKEAYTPTMASGPLAVSIPVEAPTTAPLPMAPAPAPRRRSWPILLATGMALLLGLAAYVGLRKPAPAAAPIAAPAAAPAAATVPAPAATPAAVPATAPAAAKAAAPKLPAPQPPKIERKPALPAVARTKKPAVPAVPKPAPGKKDRKAVTDDLAVPD